MGTFKWFYVCESCHGNVFSLVDCSSVIYTLIDYGHQVIWCVCIRAHAGFVDSWDSVHNGTEPLVGNDKWMNND